MWLLASVLSAVGLLAAPASAQVMQTGGDVIPKQSGTQCRSNVSVCINENEVAEGGDGDIDAIETATISQETFNPLCELTFKVVARGADYKNTFGWYPVKRDASGAALAPELADLHVFLGCDDAVGVEKTLTIPSDVPEIGFFLANNNGSCVATMADPLGPTLTSQPSNLFFSQRAFNSDGDGLIHLLVWQSRANPNAFYFGWEDKSGGGDNDFEDLLTFVTGIQCASAGEPCQAEGEQGACADGVMQCRDGALVCTPTQGPSTEQCNGIDDDCNGETDEGELCPPGELCVKGNCVPPCGTGEFRCPQTEVCVQGVCVERSCANVECPEGSVCRGGDCVAPCDDVVCPYGAACRNGLCVDVCAGVECDPGFACEARVSEDGSTLVGVCSSCDCRGCGNGKSCVAHLCVDDACADVTCDQGQHCVDGSCVDDCDGAVCPRGQLCQAGACVDDPNGGSGDGGANGNGDGGEGNAPIVIDPNGGSMSGGGTGAQGGDDEGRLEVVGCGCVLPGRGGASGALALTALALTLGLARRRKTRS